MVPILALAAFSITSGGQEHRKAPPRERAQGCEGGCAQVPADIEHASHEKLRELLSALTRHAPGAPSPQLEEVLFYWRDVEPHLNESGLDDAWIEFLRRELARRKVTFRLRVRGAEAAPTIAGTHSVTLGRKAHLYPQDVRGVQPLEIACTVRRVGLRHLWTRL